MLTLLRYLTPPIIPSGASKSIKFAAAAPTGTTPTELHPPPDGASSCTASTSGSGVAVTTIITGVCVGGTGVTVGSGVDVGAGVSVGSGV
ncbi:MAG: hypothetical protein OXG80_04280 [Chloroflexi bacterium]|nr:hypothetical protein [Chloroflexota bacterium]